MLIFPDPAVSTEYTDPNGSVWEFNGTGWVRQCAGSGVPPDALFDAGTDAIWSIHNEETGLNFSATAWSPDLSTKYGTVRFDPLSSDFDSIVDPSKIGINNAKCGDDEGNVYFTASYSGMDARSICKINRYGIFSKVAVNEPGAIVKSVDKLQVEGGYLYAMTRTDHNMIRIPLSGIMHIDANGGVELVDTNLLSGNVTGSVAFGKIPETGQWYIGGAVQGSTNKGSLFAMDESTGVVTSLTHAATNASIYPQYNNCTAGYHPRRRIFWVVSNMSSPNRGAYYMEMRGGPPYDSTRMVPGNSDATSTLQDVAFLSSAAGGLGAGFLLPSSGSVDAKYIEDINSRTSFTFDSIASRSSSALSCPTTMGSLYKDGLTVNPNNGIFYVIGKNGCWGIPFGNGDSPSSRLKASFYSDDPTLTGVRRHLIHTSSYSRLSENSTPLTIEEQRAHDEESDRLYAEFIDSEIARIESELASAVGEEKDRLSEQLSFYNSEKATTEE